MTKMKSPHKSAIIIGVTGQDGSYLAEHLYDEGYVVLGVKRRTSTNTTVNLTSLQQRAGPGFSLMEGDITDYASVSGVFTHATEKFGGAPTEVYNLAAQSHVGTSFQQPLATWDSTAQGVLNILEVMRQGGYIPSTRFYQASTSEMFGTNSTVVDGRMVQTEGVAFAPQSPYAIAKVAAHQAVTLYRDAYGLFGCCGILFNHESPRRGEHFVTRKITKYVAWLIRELEYKSQFSPEKLGLGCLTPRRDWGHAKDYVRAMHMMLQHDKPDDYIVATGESHSVQEFCDAAFGYARLKSADWVYTDPQFTRPAEVPHLEGISDNIKKTLGWEPQITFEELVADMVSSDLREIQE